MIDINQSLTGISFEQQEQTLEICQNTDLRLKAPKCTIGAAQVEVVGFVCDTGGHHLSEQRIQSIMDIPAPKTFKELQSILGSFNYVSRFVPDSSRLLEPLNRLRKKNSEFSWGEEQDTAFAQFKEAVSQNISLAYPDLSKPWVLQTDASMGGYGGVLFQKGEVVPNILISMIKFDKF